MRMRTQIRPADRPPLGALARRVIAVLALAALGPGVAAQRAPPLPIDALGTLARQGGGFEEAGPVDGGPGYRGSLLAYRHAGLRLKLLVAEPLAPPPPSGWPVLVANHGFHPDPPRYGITPAGRDWRPGDYYRPVPSAYVAAGFLVLMPDYRGHNSSEGREFTLSMLSSSWYTEDVLALLAALPNLPPRFRADLRNVFMWGHSLGGEISLRALLAAPAVRGASLWSTVGGDVWEQAWRASREQLVGTDSPAVDKPRLQALRRDIAALAGGPYDSDAREPRRALRRLGTPLMLQHAVADPATDVRWSLRIAHELARRELPYELHVLPGKDHFFQGEQFDAAVARDVAFFRRLMDPPR